MFDDDAGSESPAELYAEALVAASAGALEIDVRRPGRLNETIAVVKQLAPQGLLLDVALTNALDDQQQPVGFDGIALAQQVRTLQTRARSPNSAENLPEFPIIRLSKRDVVREYVNKDSTSDDLFDEHIDKEVVLDDPNCAARIAVALATDYPAIIAFANVEPEDAALAKLLGCEGSLLSRLDPRVLLGLRRPGAPAHVLARFVVVELLGRAGPLVDSELLAVRLGVDTTVSDDWPKLAELLEASRYAGVFAGGYARWWMASTLDWWQREIDEDSTPARLSAVERVNLIKAATRLERLTPVEGTGDSPGTRFWHRCANSDRPVDAAEGFPLLPVYGMETWHDTEYLCLEEALRNPRHKRLAPSEQARVQALIRKRGST
jgi:hypothetical protein